MQSKLGGVLYFDLIIIYNYIYLGSCQNTQSLNPLVLNPLTVCTVRLVSNLFIVFYAASMLYCLLCVVYVYVFYARSAEVLHNVLKDISVSR